MNTKPATETQAKSISRRLKEFSKITIASMMLLAVGIVSASAAISPADFLGNLGGAVKGAAVSAISTVGLGGTTAEGQPYGLAAYLPATTWTVSCPTTSNASPNASNDARVCINSYITNATAGDILEFPVANYQIQGTIVVNKALTLRGANYGVKATGSARGVGETKFTKVTNASYGMSFAPMSIESDGVTVDGFEIGDTGNNGIALPGFSVAGSIRQDIQIVNNWIHLDGATGSSGAILFGLNTTAAGTYKNVTISRNYITRSAHNPIRISGSSTSLNNFEVSSNYLSASAANSFQHWGAGSGYSVNTFKFQNNVVEGGSVSIASVTNGTVTGNVFKAVNRSTNVSIGMDPGVFSENTMMPVGSNTAYVFFIGNNASWLTSTVPSKNVTIKNNLFGQGSFIDVSDSGGLDATTFYMEKNRFIPAASPTDCSALVANNPGSGVTANVMIRGSGATIPSNLNYWGQSSGVDTSRFCNANVTEGSWIKEYSDDPAKFGADGIDNDGTGDDTPGFWPLYAVDVVITSDLSTSTLVYDSYTVAGTVEITGIGGDTSFISGPIPGKVEVSDGDDDCTATPLTEAAASLTYDFSCSLRSKKAAVNKQIVATYSDTSSSANYATTASDAVDHTVDRRDLTLDAVTDSKTYDATKASDEDPVVTGLYDDGTIIDTITVEQEFVSKNVLGAGLSTLRIKSGYVISDNNGGNNYNVATDIATGTITPAALTVSAVTDSKTYDATTDSDETPTYSGNLGSDTVTGLDQVFQSKDVLGTNGSTLQVVSGYTVNDGNLGGNYTISTPTASGTITAAPVTITAGDYTGVYDGSAHSPSACVVTGTYTGALTCDNDPSSVGPDVGSGTVVPEVVLNGETATNFTVTPANGSWSITAAPVTITAGDYTGVYDGSAHSPSACVVTGTYTGALTCDNDPASVKDVGSGVVSPVLVLNGETATNFDVTETDGSWSITAAPVTITAGDYTGVYDGSAHSPSACVVTGTYTGALTCDNDPSSVGPDVGSGTVVPEVVLNGETATNFTVTPANGSWSITAAPVTITAGDYTGVYDGSAHSPSACVVTGTYTGALTCDNDPASVKDVGSGVVSPVLVLNGETATNFDVTETDGSWSITAAPVTITAGDYTGVYDGSAHSPSACVVTGTYTGALTCDNDPSSVGPDVGSGTVVPEVVLNGETATNFTVTPANGSWSITAAPVTITAGDYTGVYDGSAHSPSACVVTGTYTGALTCDNDPSSVGPDVGSGTVVPEVVLNGETATNFTVTPANGSWSITAAPVTITAGDYTGVYDGSAHSPSACVVTGTYTGALTCDNDPSSVGPDVGSGTVVPEVVLNGETATNFTVTPANGSWSITAAPLTVTASAENKVYDDSAQATVELDASDIAEGDDVGFNFTSATFSDRHVGENKVVTVTGITLTGADIGNYSIANVGAEATTTANITPKGLTITAVTDTKIYDANTSSDEDPTSDGLEGDDSITGLDQVFTSKDVAGTNGSTLQVVSGYTVNDGNSGNNYTVDDSGTATGTITAKTLTVTPANKSVTYGDSEPTASFYTFTVTGFAGSESAANAEGYSAPTCGSAYTDGTHVNQSPLTISCGGSTQGTAGAADNYSFSYSTASLTINKAGLTITPSSYTVEFGSAAPLYAYTVTGFVNGEDGTTALNYVAPVCGSAYTVGSNPGSYAISCPASATDYSFTQQPASVTVTPYEMEPADAWYTGQLLYYTKSTSDTAVQATLTASITANFGEGCTGGASVSDGKVTFKDKLTGKIFASNVPIAEVGGQCGEGIASTIVTLSTGQYFVENYVIVVEVSGSLTGSNDVTGGQVDTEPLSMTVTVSAPPPTASGLFGAGEIPYKADTSLIELGTEGTLTSVMTSTDKADFSFGFTYGKKGVTPKGRAHLFLPGPAGSFYYVKSTSITSVTSNLTTKTATVYAKATVAQIPVGCSDSSCMIALEGNASLRLDMTDAGDLVGFTVQSGKNSALLYSNDWFKSGKVWATRQSSASGTGKYVTVN